MDDLKLKALSNHLALDEEEAKEIEEPFGIWGGLNEVERKRNLIFS